ncbi:MAG: flagella synthesis protein FlgN [Gammaproteobacteria bacterium]
MKPADPAALRQRLEDNLASHLDCTRLLACALEDERSALVANDIAALERVTLTKAAASEQLSELGRTLNRLREESSAPRIDDLLARCDPSGAAHTRWHEVIDLAAQCAEANRANAALLDARRNRVRQALRLLGSGGTVQTYGASGEDRSAPQPRTLGLA